VLYIAYLLKSKSLLIMEIAETRII